MTLTTAPLAITCFALLATGYALFFILGRQPRLAPVIREAWPILHIETLIVAIVAGSLWIGGWLLVAVLLAHAARVGFEVTKVTALRSETFPPLVVALAIAAISALAALLPLTLICALGLAGVILCLALLKFAGWHEKSSRSITLELLAFPLLPLIVFTAAGIQGGVAVWLLLAFILVETFDSYALLGGKLFGKRLAFPLLSPKKTVEGLAIGAAMLMLTAALLGALLAGIPVWTSAAIALFTGALTVAGDLAASRLKRASGVKDFPVVLPHQGGLFDTTDAWIATGAGLITLAAFTGLA